MTTHPPTIQGTAERRLTGRAVLVMLLIFFGLIMVVNVFMMRAAISTFGGVDTPSSYKAGLDYSKNAAAAEAQRARGWTVDGVLDVLDTAGDAQRRLTVTIADASGTPVSNATVEAVLAHLVDSRRDVTFDMIPIGSGRYEGVAEMTTGQWRLELAVVQDGETVFRSRNKLGVR
ncbi:FixH family protein [Bauldia sp.]|uniref:FixH family protein n=1 Tax=Bauldia sp. TaxID=2575872 RepID=UPI003BAC7ACC